jgi:hypothetical protein
VRSELTPYVTGDLPRSGVTLAARRSGMPQPATVFAPPESNADIEPTSANACWHARAAACASPAVSVRVSRGRSFSVRPQIFLSALKYAMYASTACRAVANSPGTGPLMSDAFAMVISLAVMPVVFRSPVQSPAGTLGSVLGSGSSEVLGASASWACSVETREPHAPSERHIAPATTMTVAFDRGERTGTLLGSLYGSDRTELERWPATRIVGGADGQDRESTSSQANERRGSRPVK